MLTLHHHIKCHVCDEYLWTNRGKGIMGSMPDPCSYRPIDRADLLLSDSRAAQHSEAFRGKYLMIDSMRLFTLNACLSGRLLQSRIK